VPKLPKKLSALSQIANNLWFSWNLEAVELFSRIDHVAWEETGHNPIRMLGQIEYKKLQDLADDQKFLLALDRVYKKFQQYLQSDSTYSFRVEKPLDYKIAYFSAEYGLGDCLPIYSGGLGILSGDHLKSASDLNVPLVAIGLMYQEGYFRQYLNQDGWQQELYPENDLYNMPVNIEKAEREKGEEYQSIEVEFFGNRVLAKVWKVQVGRVPLYLLDTNTVENPEEFRDTTAQLYGGDVETRLRQEILLGIGGIRALRKLGIEPEVYHMNEGHSAFATLERIRNLMKGNGLSFQDAKQAVISNNIFTTHTPVPAGNDRFAPELMAKYFSEYVHVLGISFREFMGLGRENPWDENEPFCMTVLAMRLSGRSNGVSLLHADVSRKMWSKLWPDFASEDIPISGITNGVHIPSWVSKEMVEIFERYLGPKWSEDPDPKIWKKVVNIPNTELWTVHQRRRERLVAFARQRLRDQLIRRGSNKSEIQFAYEVLNPEALTIGFARRFATYKRGILIFKDEKRLSDILNNSTRPVQIIFAGKAHPKDQYGKELIKQIVHFSKKPNFRHRIVFIEDYDINIARYLVQGVDLWLNNPRRPLEACGTSGMKVAANGGLNMSILDGWWCEGYNENLGWAIGHEEEYKDMEYQDAVESQAIYDLLEKEVAPTFYDRGVENLPTRWISMMKETLKSLCPAFSSHRMVEDYVQKAYSPASENWRVLYKDNYKGAREMAHWMQKIMNNWSKVEIKNVNFSETEELQVGAQLDVTVDIFLGEMQPGDITLDVYYGEMDNEEKIFNREMVRLELQKDIGNGNHLFHGVVSCRESGKFVFGTRVIPYHSLLPNPYFPGLVFWG
jgi:starch phosphorylase